MVIDHETWITDLNAANTNNKDKPIWYRLYSARSKYRMNGMRPYDWHILLEQMETDDELFDLYHKFVMMKYGKNAFD